MAVTFHIVKNIPLKKPILIEGFPGMGLVGTISASYLVDKLNMDFIGYITSDRFPPLAAIHKHQPMYPARLYASKKHNLIVLLSEFIVPIRAVYELSDAIYDFAKKKKVSQIISLGAIVQKGDDRKIFAVASIPSLQKKFDDDPRIQLVGEGVTTGVTGVLLARGALDKFPVVSFLAQANADYMDPMASVTVLETLKDYVGIRVDTSSLKDEAHDVEAKMKDMLSKAKQTQDHYHKTTRDGMSDDFGAMYG
ncbi:MAG: PAC2 family protein [Candidatus Micrarchaeia archaeon]